MKYQIKSNGHFEIKDVDEKKGVVKGYAAIFENVDSDGDIFIKGAFTKSINERIGRIKHLWQHDTWTPIAIPREMKEDNTGLYFVSEFGKDTFSQDKLQMHIDGLITELSVGFNTIKWETDADAKVRKLQEVKLWEYSSVTWGANSLTHIISAKGEDKEDIIEKANNRMEILLKALKNGKYTDESAESFEIELKQIQQLYIDLISQPEQSTDDYEPEVSTHNEIKEFYKHLKL